MSSFIVRDGTINDILAAVQLYTQCSGGMTPPAPRHLLPVAAERDDYYALGLAMRTMNVEAVVARYGPSDELPGPSPLRPYEYRGVMPPSPIQAIKTLACYLYQCSEGEVPEQRLFQQLTEWRNALCYHLVTQSDEWQQASWA